MDTLKDVPEFFETQLDESLVARTESLGIVQKSFIIAPSLHSGFVFSSCLNKDRIEFIQLFL